MEVVRQVRRTSQLSRSEVTRNQTKVVLLRRLGRRKTYVFLGGINDKIV